MQLLEALNDSIRKIEKIAVSAPECNIELCYDENLLEEMKMLKAAEEDANKVSFVIHRSTENSTHPAC